MIMMKYLWYDLNGKKCYKKYTAEDLLRYLQYAINDCIRFKRPYLIVYNRGDASYGIYVTDNMVIYKADTVLGVVVPIASEQHKKYKVRVMGNINNMIDHKKAKKQFDNYVSLD